MRAISLILIVLGLAVVAAPAPAGAQTPYRIEILLTGNEEQRRMFREELERHLAEFVDRLPVHVRNRLGARSFASAPASLQTMLDARMHWQNSTATLVVILGRVASHGEAGVRTMGRVYLGFPSIQRLVQGSDVYNDVLGQVGNGGQHPRFELYQKIVGYALLLRAWQLGLPPEHIDTIAARIGSVPTSALTASSRCHEMIARAVRVVRSKAVLQNQAPPARITPVLLDPFRCI
jgi:hypothetical protein